MTQSVCPVFLLQTKFSVCRQVVVKCCYIPTIYSIGLLSGVCRSGLLVQPDLHDRVCRASLLVQPEICVTRFVELVLLNKQICITVFVYLVLSYNRICKTGLLVQPIYKNWICRACCLIQPGVESQVRHLFGRVEFRPPFLLGMLKDTFVSNNF